MTILTGIVALIVQAGSGLEAITASRLFPVFLPEHIGAGIASAPAMTYHVIGGSSVPTFETSGPQKMRVQFDCFAATYKTASSVREALRALLNGFYGSLPNGVVLQNAEFIQSIDFFENDARQFRCMAEFYLYFNFTS